MNIKLINNSKSAVFSSVSKNMLLQKLDDNYELNNYKGKRYYLLNTLNNQHSELAPGVKKYFIADIFYASESLDYIMFFSAEAKTENVIEVIIYRFLFSEMDYKIVYKIEIPVEEFNGDILFKLFMLDENHFIIEKNGHDSRFFYDIVNNIEKSLDDYPLLSDGIEHFYGLKGNRCALVFGNNNGIGIVNPKQLISEILIDKHKFTIQMIDVKEDNIEYPFIKKHNARLIYTKVNVENDTEEIVMYDYVNDVKQIRFNDHRDSAADFSHTYCVNDNPYLIHTEEDVTSIVNLNTQKHELDFPKGFEFEYLKDDIMVVRRQSAKGLFKKKMIENIEVYHFLDFDHCIFKTKNEFNGCTDNEDDLIIFTR